ncbi:MAG: SGNH/GDSL hydrolase family protein [Hungatella sp.]
MKRILCYGDSNTWGTRPDGLGRWGEDVRWPARLATALGGGWRIIEEGCGARTAAHEDPTSPSKNGMLYLPPCLHSHRPLDGVILSLGTNDLKLHFDLNAAEIAAGVGELVRLVQTYPYGYDYAAPQILVIVPAPLGVGIQDSKFGPNFNEKSLEVSHHLGPAYEAMAQELGVALLNASDYATPGPDQLHYDHDSHMRLADAIYAVVAHLF